MILIKDRKMDLPTANWESGPVTFFAMFFAVSMVAIWAAVQMIVSRDFLRENMK